MLGNAADLAERYRTAHPFPHLMLDHVFPEEQLRKIHAEIGAARINPEAPGYGWLGKRRASELEHFPPATRKLVEELNSPAFLGWLEGVTNIEGLEPDPWLEGGGIHQTPIGGYLKVHTDFNWHRRLSMHRRVNVLLYLNLDWNQEWGGQLELWDEYELRKHGGKPSVSISPLFNRMVIFSTTDFSYHGHPHPLTCPPGRSRDSIALYYYTRERPQSEIRFGNSEMTNYRATGGEKLGIKHRLHQLLIRHPMVRNTFFRLTGRG